MDEEGLGEVAQVTVPGCFVVALAAAVVVAVVDELGHGVLVGVTGVVAFIVAWNLLWELFKMLHPRFASGKGQAMREISVIFGPPIVSMAAMVC